MESQTVDTLKKGDTQRNGQTGSLLINQTVDIQKRGMHLKCGHKKRAANPPKQTEVERHRNVKVDIWAFQNPRASDTMNHRIGEDADERIHGEGNEAAESQPVYV